MDEVLRGRRVTLRPLAAQDMAARAKWTADPELARLMGASTGPAAPQTSPEEEVRRNLEWLERRRKCGAMPYAVEVDGRYIGDIDYGLRPQAGKADLTVFLGDRWEWGKGYGAEAAELVICEMFRDERIRSVEVDVAACNDRAFRFWNKMGFRLVSVDDKGARLMIRFQAVS